MRTIHRVATSVAAAAVVWISGVRPAAAADDCRFVRGARAWALTADCTTDATIVVPVALLDGRGFTITAVDPPGGHFLGAVVRNGGPVLHVADLRVTAAHLADACDDGDDRLRGILLDGASGSVTGTAVVGLAQGESGCQEGNAIDVRNLDDAAADAPPVDVRIEGNVVSGYQKTGILVAGRVRAEVERNLVDGGGPVAFIARNGVQIGAGARAEVRRNRISGNAYTGSDAVAAGVLIVGGPLHAQPFTVDTEVEGNVIVGSDVGVLIDDSEADGSASAAPTRIDVEGNFIAKADVTNGVPYSAGVLDIGNRDRIIDNRIDGAAYDPATIPGATFDVDARFAIAPIVRHNR